MTKIYELAPEIVGKIREIHGFFTGHPAVTFGTRLWKIPRQQTGHTRANLKVLETSPLAGGG